MTTRPAGWPERERFSSASVFPAAAVYCCRSHFLTADQLGAQGGWTDTFDAKLLYPSRLCQIVEQEQTDLQLLPRRVVETMEAAYYVLNVSD
jgi:hypothetical protein